MLVPKNERAGTLFAALAGACFGLVVLKVGNPVVLEHLLAPPSTTEEVIYQSWPTSWGCAVLTVACLAASAVVRFQTSAPKWAVYLPLVWFGWQLLAATQTVDATLTRLALAHFTACMASFYLGLFALSRVRRLDIFWAGLAAGFLAVLFVGLMQHHGGLEETRRFLYESGEWQKMSPDLRARMSSDRIFATLVYPNAFAGVILLLLPVTLALATRITERLGNIFRGVIVGSVAYLGIACLVWSGSKAGWLIALGFGLVVVGRMDMPRKVKLGFVVLVAGLGLAGFAIKFDEYFRKGARSVGARFEYWQAALQTAESHPMFGTGPGTFAVSYKRLKRPEAEMARLAHNDFLQQASDSGWIGFLAYLAIITGSLVLLYRDSNKFKPVGWFPAWLGVTGWAAQSVVEFGLYIPALAWPSFLMLGWLWGTSCGEMASTIQSKPAKQTAVA